MSVTSQVEECAVWLKGVLGGGALKVSDLIEMAEDEGFPKTVFFRAKEEAGVKQSYNIEGFMVAQLVDHGNGIPSRLQGAMDMATAKAAKPSRARPVPLDEAWLDYSKPRAEVMVISPRIAKLILDEKNPTNRKINQVRVNIIADELINDRWKLNGETIIFDWLCNVKNGQHRLTACVQTGVSLVTWVVFGVDPGCFDTIDRGRNRKVSEDMAMRGEKNCTALSSILYLIWLDEQEELKSAMNRSAYFASPQVLQAVLDRHPEVRVQANWACSSSIRSILNPSIAAFLRYRFFAIDRAAAETFFDDLKSGANLDAKDPVLVLRNRLQNDRSSKAKLPKTDILALVIKAWNFRRLGKNASLIAWKPMESFPVILGSESAS